MDIEKLSRQTEGVVDPVGEKANAVVQKAAKSGAIKKVAIAIAVIGAVLAVGFVLFG